MLVCVQFHPIKFYQLAFLESCGTGILQLDPTKPKQNATWISNWSGMGNPSLDVGSSPVSINGNSDPAMMNSLVGATFFCPVVKASTDDGPLPKNQEVLGTTRVTLKKVRGPMN
jgi:hypothetical protein